MYLGNKCHIIYKLIKMLANLIFEVFMIKYEIGDVIKYRRLTGSTATCSITNKFSKHKESSLESKLEKCFEGRIIDSTEFIDCENCFGWDSEIISVNGKKVNNYHV